MEKWKNGKMERWNDVRLNSMVGQGKVEKWE